TSAVGRMSVSENGMATTASTAAEIAHFRVGPSRRTPAAMATSIAESAYSHVYCFSRALSTSNIGLSAHRHATTVAARRDAPAMRVAKYTTNGANNSGTSANVCAQPIESDKPIHQRIRIVKPGALAPMWSARDSDARRANATHASSDQMSWVPT